MLARGEADEALRKLADAPPGTKKFDRPLLHTVTGDAYRETFRFAEAEREYSTALDLDRDLAPAYYGRGLVRLARGAADKAIADLKRAVEKDPVHYKAIVRLADIVAVKQGDLAGARAILDRAKGLADNLPFYWLTEGLLRIAEGNDNEAETAFSRARGTGATEIEIAQARLKGFLLAGDRERAAGELRAIADDGTAPEPLRAAARTALKNLSQEVPEP